MTIRALLLAAVPAILVAGCATVPPPAGPLASADLSSAGGTAAGSVLLTETSAGLRLSGTLIGLPPGPHGLHLHAVGACAAPAFTTAGPHLNPSMHAHGSLNPRGPHLGDLPNVTADQTGRATLDAVLPGTPAELKAALFDADGTAIVVHAAADDYATDPSGNSGARIACGILRLN